MTKKRALPIGRLIGAITVGAVVIAAFFGGTLWLLDTFFPAERVAKRAPALVAPPPLQPVTRNSTIVVPVAVATAAIRDLMEAHAPRELSGRRDNPLSDLLGKSQIDWTVARGPLSVAGAASGLTVSAPVDGSMRVTGRVADPGANAGGRLSELLGDELGREVQKLATRAVNQPAELHGRVTVLAKPALRPDWRIEPRLSGQVAVAQGGVSIGGVRLDLGKELKPLIDKAVDDKLRELAERLRNDQSLERAARREWAKLCRSIALAAAAPGAPKLWLEVRPTKALAADPRIMPDRVLVTLGVQAQTRIVPRETKPDCQFPARLELVPQLDRGKVTLAVPIDVPFGELDKLLQAQLKGRTFSGGAGDAEVLRASVTASGDRLLISLRVKARETASWFGLGTEATVHVWGRPVLDRDRQVLQFADVAVDVDSEDLSGLLGAAARAALPALQSMLEQKAALDLKPYAAAARRNIESALADFRKPADGVEVEAAVTGLRLVGIEFDSATLRIIAEVDGTARAEVTKIAVR